MAVNNTAKTYANMEFPLAMKRQDAFALDPSTVWPTLADAQSYAKTNPTAYVGQMLSVVANGTATPYVIQNAAGDLAPLLRTTKQTKCSLRFLASNARSVIDRLSGKSGQPDILS